MRHRTPPALPLRPHPALPRARPVHNAPPGPLEARRLLARRRMGALAAVDTGSAPPPFDLGALLGLGASPAADYERGLRWEQPGRGRAARRFTPPLWRPEQAPFEWPEEAAPEDPAATVERLLGEASARAVDVQAMRPLWDVLQGPCNDPQAWLTLRVVRWLLARAVDEAVWRELAGVLRGKVALATVQRDELVEIWMALAGGGGGLAPVMALLNGVPTTAGVCDGLVAVTWRIRNENVVGRLREWLACLHGVETGTSAFLHVLAETTRRIVAETSQDRLCRLQGWLRLFHTAKWLEDEARLDALVCVYGVLAAQGYAPADFAYELTTFARRVLPALLLRAWAPVYAEQRVPSPLDLESSRPGAPSRTVDHAALMAEYATLRASRWHLHANARKTFHPLLDLVDVLASHRLPFEQLLTEIFNLYKKTRSPFFVWELLLDLRRRVCGVPVPLAAALIRDRLAAGRPRAALSIFEAVPSVPLSACPDLPLHLIRTGPLPGDRLFAILRRGRLTPLHISTTHLTAYALARSPHISHRTSFRRVWECYRFLAAHRIPAPQPLLSRALFAAGLLRPLRHAACPPRAQARWVLRAIARLEGWPVARAVDAKIAPLHHVAWLARLRRRVAARARPRRRVVRLARPARWRMRNWVRRRSGRGASGRRSPWMARAPGRARAGERAAED